MLLDDLKECQGYKRDIEYYEEKIMRLRSRVESITTQLSHTPGSTAEQNKTLAFVIQLEELEEKWKAKVIQFETKVLEVETALEQLPAREREIIRLRYFENLEWIPISEKVNYSDSHARLLASKGVKTITSNNKQL